MNKTGKIGTLLLAFVLVTSCGSFGNNNQIQKNDSLKNNVQNSTLITGRVQWPTSFNLKATINEIAPYGTVSLIYSYDHPTYPNRTIATGLTNNTGSFTINPSGFAPEKGMIYVLEVVKRNGGAKSSLLSLRTFVRWNGTNWDSITNSGLYINAKTTALAIISDLQNIPSNLTIGTINSSISGSVAGDVIKTVPLKVSWMGNDGTTTQIYTANADGTGTPVKVSNGTTDNASASFSPDGTKVAWSRKTGDNVEQIYVGNADGSGVPINIYNFSAFFYFSYPNMPIPNIYPSFSPDGTKVVWNAHNGTIFVANVNGSGTPIKVSNTPNKNVYPLFSPDSTKVVWLGSSDPIDLSNNTTMKYQVYVGNADGSGTSVKVSNGSSTDNNYPSFSPDGAKVVWSGSDGIYTANSDGTGNSIKVCDASFTAFNDFLKPPVGSTFTGTVHTNNNSGSWFSPTTSSSPTLNPWAFRQSPVPSVSLPKPPSSYHLYPSFSPDSTKVLCEGSDSQIYVVNADGTGTPVKIATESLTPSYGVTTAYVTNSHFYPSFSPDGTKVLWVRSGIIYLSNSDGTGTPVKISGSTLANSSHSFSPDGTKILWFGHDGTAYQIYVGNADGSGTPVKISTGSSTNNGYPRFGGGFSKTLITGSKVTEVANIVTNALTANYDPVRYIDYQNGIYSPTYP